jgi:hypothetical protein
MTNRQKVLAINARCRRGHVYITGFCGLNHLRVLKATDRHGAIYLTLGKGRTEYLGTRVPFQGKNHLRLWK